MSQFRVVYTVPYVAATVKAKLRTFGGNKLNGLASYTDAISGGTYNGVVGITTTTIAATGTATFSGTGTAGDTVTIGGQAFTAVASGATNNQWNVGATAAASAANLASAINTSTTSTFRGIATASALSNVVTITASVPGNVGNQITLSKSSTAITVSGSTLTGGSEDATVTVMKG